MDRLGLLEQVDEGHACSFKEVCQPWRDCEGGLCVPGLVQQFDVTLQAAFQLLVRSMVCL